MRTRRSFSFALSQPGGGRIADDANWREHDGAGRWAASGKGMPSSKVSDQRDVAVEREDPRCPDVRVVALPAHDGGVTVRGQREGPAPAGASDRAGADQLAALLGPDTAAAGVDPSRPRPR